MTADVQRVLEDVGAVFIRLDEDATRQLERSWRGDAGRRALEALRRYISEALDGLAGCPSFPGTAVPPMPALASPAAPVATVPAGSGSLNSLNPHPLNPHPLNPANPMGSHRNGFDEYGVIAPTHAASPFPASMMRAVPDAPSPLPPASLNAATTSTVPPAAAPAPAPPASQTRGGIPYLPLMGAAYPGGIGRGDGGTRRTPGFLISIDNGNELIGPLPKVSPPVLGDG
jgi:hypothetical protein